MAFSKVKVGGLADDSVTAANIDDDGTGYTVGNLTNSGTLQQTGQVTLGSGGTNWTLPTSRGANKYVLQIDGTTGASDWAESLTAPEISGHNFDVSGSTDDGGINAYEAPYEYTGTTNATTTISALSSTTGLLAGQYISGAGIPADTTIVSVDSGASTMVISNAVTVAGTQTGVALKIQKTPGEKNGGKVTLTGANFGATIGEITVAITNSAGSVIANASYLSGLSGGNTIVAEWTGTEGSYSTDLTSSYTGSIYFKMTKSGLSSNVHNTNTTLTSDPAVTALSGSSQTGGDVSTDPSATSLGAYGTGRTAGGGQDSNTKLLLNFDRGGGTDIEDSSNIGGDGHKVTVTNAVIKASPFGDGKSAMFFDGSDDKLELADHDDWDIGSGDYTVEFWMNDIGIADNDGFLGTQDSNGYSGWLIRRASGELNFNQWGSSAVEVNVSSSGAGIGSSNTWRHIAFVRHGNFYKLYIDGKNNGSVEDSSPSTLTNSSSGLTIGAYTGFANMYMDEIRIVKGIAVYTGDFDVPTSRLSATQSNQGTNIADITGTATKLLIHSEKEDDASDFHHAVSLVNGATFSTSDILGSAWGGSHYDVTGNNYIKVENYDGNIFQIPSSTPFCLEGWFKSNSTQSQHAGVFGFNDDANACLMLMFSTSNRPRVLINQAGGSPQLADITGSSAISNNTWYHAAIVRQTNNDIKFYIDGTEIGSASNKSGEIKMAGANPYFMAGTRQYTSNDYDGYVQDIRLVIGSQVYSGAFIRPNGPLTTTGGSYSDATNVDTSITSGHCKLLLGGNQGVFTDSATSGTTHTITPTGVFHTYSHGGIAPALTWPASGKATGSAGMFFNGTNAGITTDALPSISGALTVDLWFYPVRVHPTAAPFVYRMSSGNGSLLLSGTQIEFTTFGGQNFTTGANTVNWNQWNHFCYSRDGSGNYQIFINGTRTNNGSGDSANSPNATMAIGYRGSAANYHHGYITNFRISNSDETVSGGSLYNSSATAITLPTRAYGAYGPSNPDVGTITLTATGDGDFTWSEVAGGTALPGTLAVGSTTHSGSGNSRTHTATITGKLSTNTSTTFTNGVRGDTATNNILLKVQHDTDATKAVTLNDTTGMSITNKSTERPVLFNARRYHGNVSNRTINEFGFSSDLVWIKNRDNSSGYHHAFYDTVRGANKTIKSSSADQQATNTDQLNSFLSDGFSLGDNSDSGNYVNLDNAYIAWAWKAGGAPTATNDNTSGAMDANSVSVNGTLQSSYTPSGSPSIYPKKMSVNTAGGFSIIQYTKNATAGATVPHGLSQAPEMVIVKDLGADNNWMVYHKYSGEGNTHDSEDYYLSLDQSIAATDSNTRWNDTAPSSSVVTLGSSGHVNGPGGPDYIMYCWHSVTGVSKIGTYQGNSSTQTITTGFKPRFVMIKSNTATGSWSMWDTFRSFASGDLKELYANGSGAEPTSVTSTFLITLENTGFKFTNISHVSLNNSSHHYAYMAFA